MKHTIAVCLVGSYFGIAVPISLPVAAWAQRPAAPSTAGSGAAPAQADDFRDLALEAHNSERALVGEPPLRWDPILEAQAASWAKYLASLGRLVHDTGSGEGENLWMGEPGFYTVREMVADWSGEKINFYRGTFPYVSRTGHWHDVGHYTQIVWRQTERLGCGKATTDDGDYLVCRYRAPGNVVGEKPY